MHGDVAAPSLSLPVCGLEGVDDFEQSGSVLVSFKVFTDREGTPPSLTVHHEFRDPNNVYQEFKIANNGSTRIGICQ